MSGIPSVLADFLSILPDKERDFILNALRVLPADNEERMLLPSDIITDTTPTCFRRHDLEEFIRSKASPVLVVNGRRRTGKSFGLLNSLIRVLAADARYPSVIFYYTAAPGSCIRNFLCEGTFMGFLRVCHRIGVPLIFDEFQADLQISCWIKLAYDGAEGLRPYSAILFGSHQALTLHESSSTFYNVTSIRSAHVPPPSVSVVLSVLKSRLTTRSPTHFVPLDQMLLKFIAMFGTDLAKLGDVEALTTRESQPGAGWGTELHLGDEFRKCMNAMMGKSNGKNMAEVAGYNINIAQDLVSLNFLKPNNGSGHVFDDPMLRSQHHLWQAVDEGGLSTVQGMALEWILENLLDDQFRRAIMKVKGGECLEGYARVSGQLDGGAEVDALYYPTSTGKDRGGCGEEGDLDHPLPVYMVSMKRDASRQEEKKTFCLHLALLLHSTKFSPIFEVKITACLYGSAIVVVMSVLYLLLTHQGRPIVPVAVSASEGVDIQKLKSNWTSRCTEFCKTDKILSGKRGKSEKIRNKGDLLISNLVVEDPIVITLDSLISEVKHQQPLEPDFMSRQGHQK
jgi:hypothetical protein